MTSPHRDNNTRTTPTNTNNHHHHDNDNPLSVETTHSSCKKRPREGTDNNVNDNDNNDNDNTSAVVVTTKKVMTTTTTEAIMTTTTPTTTTTTTIPIPIPDQIQGLRLEAIFHPKFDNERRNPQQQQQQQRGNGQNNNNNNNNNAGNPSSHIRTIMWQKLQTRQGYLEVSLKHSGSLLLWSGGQRYFSKNSCRNAFTQVGEILLRQHFERVTMALSNKHNHNNIDHRRPSSPEDMVETIIEKEEYNYHKCSEYVQQHRLTLAFEVVTAVLGDHGAIPQRDFLILTAVADRAKERFFSTMELLEFCQRFRLPHNDVWTFTTETEAQQLFEWYDGFRETARTQQTMDALGRAADVYVPSMYPHEIFQGEILEGFIIRYIPYQEILQEIPPTKPPCFELGRRDDRRPSSGAGTADTDVHNTDGMPTTILSTNVRDIYNDVPYNYVLANAKSHHAAAAERGSAFSRRLAKLLGQRIDDDHNGGHDDGDNHSNDPENHSTTGRSEQVHHQHPQRHDLVRLSGGNRGFHLPSLVKHLVNADDTETRRIAEVLQTLDSVKGTVSYSFFQIPRSKDNDTDRLLCMIHVINDSTFFKFQRQQSPGGMPLFRGFCVEILSKSTTNGNGHECALSSMAIEAHKDCDGLDDNMLMLKMKLLPYMSRTFICRNLLKILLKDGPQKFAVTAEGLMDKWGMSEEAKDRWLPFFNGWAQYVMTQKDKLSDLGPLTDSSYLRHLEHYTDLYENGKVHVQPSLPSSSLSNHNLFDGFVCVVSLTLEVAEAVAEYIAHRLSGNDDRTGSEDGATAVADGSSITVISLEQAVKSKMTRSCITFAQVDGKIKGIKEFMNKVAKQSIFVLYGSDPDDIIADGVDGVLSEGDKKRINAQW
jgi:hypothetical protein